jgi:hypothetical protein
MSDTKSAVKFIPVTKGTALVGPCRALNVGTAGTANLTELDGTQRDNYPLVAGYNPIQVREVRAGGTAENIWALY